MKLSYFEDTDTLYVELDAANVAETVQLNDDTLLDLDSLGNICAVTIEHASVRTDLQRLRIGGFEEVSLGAASP